MNAPITYSFSPQCPSFPPPPFLSSIHRILHLTGPFAIAAAKGRNTATMPSWLTSTQLSTLSWPPIRPPLTPPMPRDPLYPTRGRGVWSKTPSKCLRMPLGKSSSPEPKMWPNTSEFPMWEDFLLFVFDDDVNNDDDDDLFVAGVYVGDAVAFVDATALLEVVTFQPSASAL